MRTTAMALRVLGAAALGSVAAAGYAVVTGLAFNTYSRSWEMGAIPLLLAAFMFVGLLAGTIAGLGCRTRPYLSALLAMLLLFVVADQVNARREALTPLMTPAERREFWANIEGLLFGGGPLGLAVALWGALIVDPKPGRLRGLRDLSYALVGLLGFVALIPPAVYWFQWKVGLLGAAVSALAFTAWIARRNSRAAGEVATMGT